VTPAELAAIRDRYDRGVCSERDIADLLAEVERLTARQGDIALTIEGVRCPEECSSPQYSHGWDDAIAAASAVVCP
jgi:hypothetical protein